METDLALVQLVQSVSLWLAPALHALSFLGTEPFYLVAAPALLWCVDASLGLQVGLLLMTSANLNATAKMLFGTPRPYWIDPGIRGLASEPSFGFPSGHAQNSTALWGMLACAAQRPWVTFLSLALILGISLSRVALGVHSATDLLGGWLIGAVLLFGFLKFGPPVGEWARAGGLTGRILAAWAASLGLLALGVVIQTWIARPPLAEWVAQAASGAPGSPAIDPLNLSSTVSSAGAWFGLAAGGILLLRWGRFRAGGPWELRAARYALGTAGLLALYIGLRALLPHGEDLLGSVVRYLRYAALGLWIAIVAPWLFVRLGLCREAGSGVRETPPAAPGE
jgi:membrane-associated phospholipid phosphatase